MSCSKTPCVTPMTIEELMAECEKDSSSLSTSSSSSGFLSTHVSGKALCCLTLLVDKYVVLNCLLCIFIYLPGKYIIPPVRGRRASTPKKERRKIIENGEEEEEERNQFTEVETTTPTQVVDVLIGDE